MHHPPVGAAFTHPSCNGRAPTYTKKQSIDAVINFTNEKEQFAESVTCLTDTPGILGKLAA